MRWAASALIVALGVAACSSSPGSTATPVRHMGGSGGTLAKDSPGWVTDQFYGWTAFPSESAHVTGEFARRFDKMGTLGALLKPTAKVSLPRALAESDTRAVYATTISEAKRTAEWYTYLVREQGTWKIEAVRTLEFKPLYYALLDSLRRGWHFPDAPPTLRQTMELTIAPDSAIRKYFVLHQEKFQAMADAFRAQPTLQGVDLADVASVRARHGKPVPNDREAPVRALLSQTAATTVFRDVKFPGCVFVRIGGMGGAHAGYMYAPAGCTVPPMNPHSFIYIQKIRGAWYAYKAL